jgi:hypothetical protein
MRTSGATVGHGLGVPVNGMVLKARMSLQDGIEHIGHNRIMDILLNHITINEY